MSDAETDRRKREAATATATEAATAPGAVRDGAGEERQGETESVRESSTSRERGD